MTVGKRILRYREYAEDPLFMRVLFFCLQSVLSTSVDYSKT